MNRIGDNLICTSSNEEIVRAFAEAGVEFLVIGGLAVAWYCQDRQADDMDLLINPTPDNSARVARALTSLPSVNSSALTSETFTRLGLQVPLKQYYHAELLTPRLDGVAYEEAAKHATIAKLFGVSVRLAAVEPLIQMKKLAAASDERSRQKHLADIERLKSQL